MKKLFLVAVLAIFSFQNNNAQDITLGVTGGLFLGSADLEIAGIDVGSISDDLDVLDGGGFYLGLLADIEVIGDFHVQPELLYANIGGESAVIVPVMAKYYVAESFNLQAGPQFDFLLDIPSIVKEAINTFGLSMAVGAGYDITEKISVQAKYSFGLNDRIDSSIDDLLGGLGGIITPSLKTNILQAGVVYKF